MAVDTSNRTFEHPFVQLLDRVPGLSVFATTLDWLLAWSQKSSFWVFPMATSCCGIEFMHANANRVDLDQMGAIVRPSPRHCDVMVVAGTVTLKMAPRIKKLWDQMPEPKWCIAMGSCAISGDFYRDIYSVVPGVDTFVPVDVYIPGCPPNADALMAGLFKLKERIDLVRRGLPVGPPDRPETPKAILPSCRRMGDPSRDPALSAAQLLSARSIPPDQPHRPTPPLPLPDGPPPVHFETDADFRSALATRFPDLAVPEGDPDGLHVPLALHLPLARFLKEEAGYTLYVTVVATHFLPREGDAEHFDVATVLRRPVRGSRTFSWRVRLGVGEAIPSLYPLFAGADWQEREQWDLVGVPFAGHPDLRRLMMPESYEGHPLRKDFAIDTPAEPWR